MPINKFVDFNKKFLKPLKKINTKIHEVLGGTPVFTKTAKKPPEGKRGSADFRQVGKSPQDKSGFPVRHLGDNK